MDSDIVCEKYETHTLKICKIVDIIDQDISDLILKPLSLASLVDLEKGTFFSKSLEARVELSDNYILGDSSLRDLGFISPIKVMKGTGSGYFLRSNSKGLVDPAISVGNRFFFTTKPSEEGTVQSDVSGALRAVDASVRVSL